ncbi:MAG: hypothetical protein HOV68_15065 [Streptomycetaceae bacterium]|nr:hypothetical protein [Streptomycetaceae bacterium]
MSAPLVVNTRDGVCWTRRTVTRGGVALYAPESVKTCPNFVMATLAELAEHGIAGSTVVLPVPVGPGSQESPVEDDRAKAPWGRGEDGRPLLPMGAHWTDVPELVDRTVSGIQARLDQAQSGHWYDASVTETWRAPGTVRTNVDGYQRTVGQFTNMLPGDLDLVLHAHDDLSWCLDMIARLRVRVGEVERKYAFDTAVLRRERDRIRERVSEPFGCTHCGQAQRSHGRQYLSGVGMHAWERPTDAQVKDRMLARRAARMPLAADGITRRIAPVQALRDDEPEMGELEEWCTGCHTDHAPNECGYRPEAGDA